MPTKKTIKKDYFKLIVFSIIIAALSIIAQFLLPQQYACPVLPYVVLFFFCITLCTLFLVTKENKKKGNTQYVTNFLLAKIIKFFSCMVFLFAYIMLNEEGLWNFAISFIIIYFLYSGFETIVLKKNNDLLDKKEEDNSIGNNK